MKIGYLSEHAPSDRKASSGTNYKMVQQLSKIGELKWIPIRQRRFAKYFKYLIKALYLMCGYNVIPALNRYFYKCMYKKVEVESFNDCDIVAAFFCMPTLANLESIKKPIIYFTDATFPAMIDYYFHNLTESNKRQGIEAENKAMKRSDIIIVSSDWAKDSALNDLKVEPNKINVVEFGANIDEKDIVNDKVPYNLNKQLELLFLGVDWIRKGGDIAVEAVRWLNDNGISTKLHIAGIKKLNENISKLPFVEYHGFLNKNNTGDYNKLVSLLKNSHALLLPTVAECSAISFAEASAYSLPVFTHDTGGIGNYIIDGVNGYKLPIGSTGIDFGKSIKEKAQNGELNMMSIRARDLYNSKLNWEHWGKEISATIDSIVVNYKSKS